MDIKYLHFLQDLRERAPLWFNNLIQFITDVSVSIIILLIPMIIFFCIDKKKGEFVLLSLSIASALNVFIKNIFCVYRPWMRSELIKPTAKAIKGAGGYSFPSGHTQGNASSFGAVAFVYRKKKPIAIPCICLVLLVAFSRNYLGVHTPQDVLAGITVSLSVIFLIKNIQKKTADSEKNRFTFFCTAVAVTAICMTIMCLKKYPVDYDNEGNILIAPERVIASFASKAGMLVGFLAAWITEKKYIDFDTENLTLTKRIIRAVTVCVIYIIAAILSSFISNVITIEWLSAFVKNVLLCFCVFLFGPLIFTKIEKSKQ